MFLGKRHTGHVLWVNNQTAFIMHYFLEHRENPEEDTLLVQLKVGVHRVPPQSPQTTGIYALAAAQSQ